MLERFKDQQLENPHTINGGNDNDGNISSVSFNYGFLSDSGYIPGNRFEKHNS